MYKRQARQCSVIDKNTGEEIPRVIWANDKTGRYRQHLIDSAGKLVHENGKIKSKVFTGNIELKKEDKDLDKDSEAT